MTTSKDITVIGGGIVGICCALSLQDKGLQVILIDEGELKRKASYGNAGVISPWSCIPQSMPGVWKNIPKWLLQKTGPVSFRWHYLPDLLPWAVRFFAAGRQAKVIEIAAAMNALTRQNIEIYRQHLDNTNQQNLIKDSCYLHVSQNKNAFSSDSLEYRLRSNHQAPMAILAGKQIQELEPALSTDYKSALLIKNQARAISPGHLVQVLTQKFLDQGGQVIKAKVEKIQPDSNAGWDIIMQGKQLKSRLLLIAAGAWSVKLLNSLDLKTMGLNLPLVNERGYHLEFKNPGLELNHSIMDVKSKFVVSFMDAGVRSAGTAEFAHINAKPNYQRAQIFKKLTKQLLPDLKTNSTSEWMGTRPSFPDSLPVIDRVPGFTGLFAAFGHSHYGLGMAPKTGRVLADIVTNSKTDVDTKPYRFERFTGGR